MQPPANISGGCEISSGMTASAGKSVSEHGQAADGGFLCRLVLNDVPVFSQLAVLEAHDVHNDPVHRTAYAAKPAVEQHVVAIGDAEPVLVAEIFWNSLDQGEKPLASGRNVGGVLNVVRRPETLCGRVVPLVEKGFEGFQHEGLILFLDRLRHLILLRQTPGGVFRSVDALDPTAILRCRPKLSFTASFRQLSRGMLS